MMRGPTFSFRTVAIVASSICLLLASGWLLAPQLILRVWQIAGPEPALVMARRGGALFLGLAATLFLARNAENSSARRAISTGLCLACATLAMLGIGEWIAGHAGIGIGLAAFVEILLSASFARTLFTD
jgi:hypothetical protein